MRHMLPPFCNLPLYVPCSAFPPAMAGRFEMSTMKDPSGAIAGSISSQTPENGAIWGGDQPPARLCVTRIVPPATLLRWKYSVVPSGSKIGAAS